MNLSRKTYIDIVVVAGVALAIFGGVVTFLIYDAAGFSNVQRQTADTDIDFVPQFYMFMTVDVKHEFDHFDEEDIDHFVSTSDGNRCLVYNEGDAHYQTSAHVNALSDTVTVGWDAPETIYCMTAEPPFFTPFTLQGVVVNVDGNGVGHDAQMHFRESDQSECDGSSALHFTDYEVEPDATGYASVHVVYKEGFNCDGLPESGDLVIIVPEYKWFLN